MIWMRNRSGHSQSYTHTEWVRDPNTTQKMSIGKTKKKINAQFCDCVDCEFFALLFFLPSSSLENPNRKKTPNWVCGWYLQSKYQKSFFCMWIVGFVVVLFSLSFWAVVVVVVASEFCIWKVCWRCHRICACVCVCVCVRAPCVCICVVLSHISNWNWNKYIYLSIYP